MLYTFARICCCFFYEKKRIIFCFQLKWRIKGNFSCLIFCVKVCLRYVVLVWGKNRSLVGNVRLNLLKNSRQKIILSDNISTRKLLVHLRKILPSRNIIWQNYFLVEIFSYFFGFAIDNFLVFRDEQMLLIVASYLFCKVKLEIHAFQWSRRAFIVKLFISEYRIVFRTNVLLWKFSWHDVFLAF